MAEPNNTPFPTAPPTPRSSSPVHPSAPQSPGSSPTTTRMPQWPHAASTHSRGTSLTVPVYLPAAPWAAAAAAVAATAGDAKEEGGRKPVVLHLGDPVRYNLETHAEFSARFDVVRPGAEERERAAFLAALRDGRWGNFAAVLRPFWDSGGEMGRWDAELIDLLPDSVRVFASAGAGFDWVDVKLLGERGIVHCNSGIAACEAVADFAVALIVGTFRALPYCMASAASGSPAAFRAAHTEATALSHNLRGHSLGVVGLGGVGQQVARRCAAAFGMEVSYYDVERKAAAVEALAGRARYRPTLEALVRGADCVVLCVPASAGRLVDAETLRWFRPGARLVNVARGALVDEDALADALEQGRLAGVALDVHADEPRVSDRLRKFAGTTALLTCHNAGGTVEAHVGFEELCMRNVMAVLAGREPLTPTNLQWLS
ncbi:putative D-isomer specific 2-hydroxyacid dehydrogenase [Rosellinia necatrix]|uniref:Putative D-isomer specific 2-hydroxyacid dehydrogenase n=1 Tax=Rosellinia necatrix TaxID=77044 RepID=A0A1W2TQP5_ROSNE|nr:putative D-isomer specific 2-hydroxyacid dehydrogenase [Rosellinia necatrix]